MALFQFCRKLWQRDNSALGFEPVANVHRLAAEGKQLFIMGVDDNPVNCKVLQAMVEKLGYQFISATSGRQAINLLADDQVGEVDMIIMDCDMPIMSGFEATKKIRAKEKAEKKKPIAIIALTGHVLEQDKINCLRVGMNYFLSKPLQYQQLKSCLSGR